MPNAKQPTPEELKAFVENLSLDELVYLSAILIELDKKPAPVNPKTLEEWACWSEARSRASPVIPLENNGEAES